MDKGKVPALVLSFGDAKKGEDKKSDDDDREALMGLAKEIRSAKSDKSFAEALEAFIGHCRG